MPRRSLLAALAAAAALGLLAASLGSLGGPVAGLPSGPTGSLPATTGAAPSATAAASPSASPSASPTPLPTPATTPRPVALRPALRERLEAAVVELRADAAIPGVSAAIVFADGSLWTGVAGDADVAAGIAVEPDTAFAAASITKTFVAALILDLSAEGRLALEDRAGAYLPELPLVETITVRQLLDHTSGLHDFFLDPRIDRALLADRTAAWTSARALGYVGKPYFPPGTEWQYSNTNYLVLGMLAERIDGRPLAAQLRARYFEPLGLASAFVQEAEQPRGPLAHGYRFAGPGRDRPPIDLADGSGVVPFRSVVTAAAGAGAVAASAADIARWADALYGGRATAPGTLDLMLADVEAVAGYEPRVPYGLGVQVVTIDGRLETWGHSGRFLGFRSVVRHVPAAGVTIAVMTNQSRADPGVILARLLRIAVPPTGPCGLCPDPR